jgi:signal peptidase I
MNDFFKWRKLRKEVKELIKSAKNLVNMRRDLMEQKSVDEIENAISDLKIAVKAKTDLDDVTEKMNYLSETVDVKRPKRNHAMFEFVEVAVVALSVAMAFRAYFFQPFKIPTGSMQPTLYGIHSVEKKSSILDLPGVKILKWAVLGSNHKVIKAKIPGQIHRFGQSKKPGYNVWDVSGHKFDIPSDVMLQEGKEIYAGEVLWEGDVYTGDHVFVNKLIWNFSKPKRSQIMVFKTTGIKGLVPNIFYIKRMVGLPNEEISITPPYLMINGKAVDDCFGIAREESQEGLYAGYQLIDPNHQGILRTSADKIITGDKQYVAMGDNTRNSLDGRYWGTVPLKNLVGTQFLVYWPISARWGITR